MKKTALSLTGIFSIFILDTRLAYAVQEHTVGEGYVVHQTAHIIFFLAMLYMIAVLRKPLTGRLSGWRYIRVAALFFLLWNLDTFLGHLAEGLLGPRASYMRGSSISLLDFRAAVYYYTRLIENFLLVSAFVFMAAGLRQLKKQLERQNET